MKIISRIDADKKFNLVLSDTENSRASICIKNGSLEYPVFIRRLIDYSIQGVYGLTLTMGNFFLFKKSSVGIKCKKIKILNIPFVEKYGHCLHDVLPKLIWEDLFSEADFIYVCGSPILNSLVDLFEISFKKILILNDKDAEVLADEIILENHTAFHIRDKEKIKLLKSKIETFIENKYRTEIKNRLIYCSRNAANVSHGRKMNEEQDYDVVLDTLQKQRDILWKMTESNMNHNLFNIMDQIRLEQIDQLDKAMKLWKTRESNSNPLLNQSAFETVLVPD